MRSCSAGPGRVIDTPGAAPLSTTTSSSSVSLRQGQSQRCPAKPLLHEPNINKRRRGGNAGASRRASTALREEPGEFWHMTHGWLVSRRQVGLWGGCSRGGGGEVLMLRLCGDRDEAVCVSNTLKDGWAGSQPGLKILSRLAAALRLAFSIDKQRRDLSVFTSRSADWEFLEWKCHPWTHMNLLTTYHVIFSFSFVSHTSSSSVR